MDTYNAFLIGEINRDKPRMVFDWDKAAQLILEHKPESAEAGLSGDMEWTGGLIFGNGAPVTNEYTYLASTWAIPILVIGYVEYDCWRMESETPGWDEHTKWPDSALEILGYVK